MVVLDEFPAIETFVRRCKISSNIVTAVRTSSSGSHFLSSKKPPPQREFKRFGPSFVTRRNLSAAMNYRI
jgi:hypothetical protein